MKKFLVLKSQRNQVLEEVKTFHLDPSQFKWTEQELEHVPMCADEAIVSRLVHTPTGYYFQFDMRGAPSWWATYSPGDQSPEEHLACSDWDNDMFRRRFRDWLKYLKREVESSDLWADICKETRLMQAATQDYGPGEHFTPEEQSQIVDAIEEIKLSIIDMHQLSEDNATLVTAKLSYLQSAVERLPRADWLHTTIGVLVSIVVAVGLGPDRARELFCTAWDSLGKFFEETANLLP